VGVNDSGAYGGGYDDQGAGSACEGANGDRGVGKACEGANAVPTAGRVGALVPAVEKGRLT
jgi:hypothetical protein